MNALDTIVGLTVHKVKEIYDYLTIEFSDGSVLNVFNNYRYNGTSISSLQNKNIIEVTENQINVKLNFDNSLELIVSLKNKDFNGPEAMEYREFSKFCVIG